MAKRKKKPSQVNIHNLQRAQHKNEFFRKLKHLVTLVSSPDIYSLIPENELERLYKIRFSSTKIVAAEGHNIPAEMMRDAKYFYYKLLTRDYEPVLPDGTKIQQGDYCSIALSLSILEGRLKAEKFPGSVKVREALTPFFDFISSSQGAETSLKRQASSLITIGMMHSDFTSKIFVLKPEMRDEVNRWPAKGFVNEIYAIQTEQIQVIWDGSYRPALRVGWAVADPTPHMKWCSIPISKLYIEKRVKGKDYDVYIQSHALIRLAERIDCIPTGSLHMNLYLSLNSNNLKVSRSSSGSFLFQYELFNQKAGYLLGDIIDGKIIIRTFLFLTANGTPEGDKLIANHGLLKEDKKFLGIDKLSTFIKSDIESNEKVKEIFIKAGCESLFRLEGFEIRKRGESYNRPVSSYIAKYLGLDEPDDLSMEEND